MPTTSTQILDTHLLITMVVTIQATILVQDIMVTQHHLIQQIIQAGTIIQHLLIHLITIADTIIPMADLTISTIILIL